jgi:hypothetical protein
MSKSILAGKFADCSEEDESKNWCGLCVEERSGMLIFRPYSYLTLEPLPTLEVKTPRELSNVNFYDSFEHYLEQVGPTEEYKQAHAVKAGASNESR